MGHVRIRETAINTRTGFKIGQCAPPTRERSSSWGSAKASSPSPRLPALEVDCLEDLLSEYGMMWLASPKFGELALEARRSVLKGEKCHREPIRLGNRVFKNPMLAMWNWDLRHRIPQRISWEGSSLAGD
jgi:hypothetical protein